MRLITSGGIAENKGDFLAGDGLGRVVPGNKSSHDYQGGGKPGRGNGILAKVEARCITSYEQLGEVREGEILVAPATTPSWTMVFGLVKGVIVASGGSLAHAAIVGREYGIPVVTNVFDGIYKIKTGQRIRIDGDAGTVYLLG